jgi:hypothetical protein
MGNAGIFYFYGVFNWTRGENALFLPSDLWRIIFSSKKLFFQVAGDKIFIYFTLGGSSGRFLGDKIFSKFYLPQLYFGM